MLCDNCKLVEMRVERVEGNVATHVCKKCGAVKQAELPQEQENNEASE